MKALQKRVVSVMGIGMKLVNVIQIMLKCRLLPSQERAKPMWEYAPKDLATVQHLFGMIHNNVWGLLFKPQKEWPVEGEDIGLDAANPLKMVSDTCLNMSLNICIVRFDPNLLMWILQGWLAKAKKISGLVPLPQRP